MQVKRIKRILCVAISFILLLGLLPMNIFAQSYEPPQDGWELIFSDEFSGDMNKWDVSPNGASIVEGRLFIVGSEDPELTGAVLSKDKFPTKDVSLRIEYDFNVKSGSHVNPNYHSIFAIKDASGNHSMGEGFSVSLFSNTLFVVEPQEGKANFTSFGSDAFTWGKTYKVVVEINNGIGIVTVYDDTGGFLWKSEGSSIKLEELRIGFQDSASRGETYYDNVKIYQKSRYIKVFYFEEDFEDAFSKGHLDSTKWYIQDGTTVVLEEDDSTGNHIARVKGTNYSILSLNNTYPIGESLTYSFDLKFLQNDEHFGVQTAQGANWLNAFQIGWRNSAFEAYCHGTNELKKIDFSEMDYGGLKPYRWYHYEMTVTSEYMYVKVTTMDGYFMWECSLEIPEIYIPIGFLFFLRDNDEFMIDNVKLTGVVDTGAPQEEEPPVVDPLEDDDKPINYDLIHAVKDDVKAASESVAMSPGTYYEATVPDTLDLAERGALLASGLTSFLDTEFVTEDPEDVTRWGNYQYAPFGNGIFNVKHPYFTIKYSGGVHNWGKITEALLMARNMSGSMVNNHIDNLTIENMLNYTAYDKYDVMHNGAITPLSRIQMSLISLYQLHPSDNLRALLDEMSRAHRLAMQFGGDYGYTYNNPPEVGNIYGNTNYGINMFVNGTSTRVLSRWATLGDGNYADTALKVAYKLKNYLMLPKFWVPEAAPEALYGPDHATLNGHIHGYTSCLIGLLRYAIEKKDVRVMEFVRDGYEYVRNFGLSAIGMYGEVCTLGDMIVLATQLSLYGVGDYWDDVDRYVRNELAERQLTSADKLRASTDQMPENQDVLADKPPYGTTTDVVNRTIGVFISDASYPTHITPRNLIWTICCTGNAAQGMYYAWKSIVTEDNGLVSVNLLLNRASKWLDVDSYLPYEGKVVLHNKTAKEIAVRIPNWVNSSKVSVRKNGNNVPYTWVGKYIYLNSLSADDEIIVSFPMEEWTETYSLKWVENDTWKESSDPGGQWLGPLAIPDQFTFVFKGNTVVKIIPSVDRTKSNAGNYLLYQRDDMLNSTVAPMKKVVRFVPDTTIQH